MASFTKHSIFFVFLLIQTLIYVHWNFNSKSYFCTTFTRDQISELKSIQEKLQYAFINNEPPSSEVMQQISALLQHAGTISQNPKPAGPTDNEIQMCTEEWTPRKDYPYFLTGWNVKNCSNTTPINKLISVVLYGKRGKTVQCFNDTISGLLKIYKQVPILLAVNSDSSCKNDWPSNVKKIVVSHAWTAGRVWNKLISQVKTSTVLIGRNLNMYLPFLSPLERLLRVLSSNSQIKIAGGSTRNITGYWVAGCFQSSMLNYILDYEEGYYKSKNECMYCNYVLSPFVTYTKLVLQMKLDEKLDDNSIFEDLFIRFVEKEYLVVNCPDVMFLANENWVKKETAKSAWKQLATKWSLNRIVLPKTVLHYSCNEVGISCKYIAKKTTSFLIPICCLEQITKAVHFFHDFATDNNLRYELQDGSALGVVKMNGFIPWDIDGDFKFIMSDFSVFRDSASNFSRKGFKLADFKAKLKFPYFALYTPDRKIEMWGTKLFASNKFFPEIFLSNPTKVLFRGKWINGPINPAGYARNKYGIEVLQHSHNWSQLNLNSSWVQLKPGYFKKCTDPTNHACLDKFDADGNIQFKAPNEKECN